VLSNACHKHIEHLEVEQRVNKVLNDVAKSLPKCQLHEIMGIDQTPLADTCCATQSSQWPSPNNPQ
jgi:hypothetical protein